MGILTPFVGWRGKLATKSRRVKILEETHFSLFCEGGNPTNSAPNAAPDEGFFCDCASVDAEPFFVLRSSSSSSSASSLGLSQENC